MSERPTFQRWDASWKPMEALNRSTGDWPYLITDSKGAFEVTTIQGTFTQAKVPDAIYEYRPETIKETIVVTLIPPDSTISTPFSTALSVRVDNSSIVMKDPLGADVWETAPFTAWDSADSPKFWERPVSSIVYADGNLAMRLDSDMLANATYPLYIDPTWTLSSSAGWGASTFQDAIEDKGDHNIKIGWLADNFNDNTNEQWTIETGTVTFTGGTMNLGASSTVRAGGSWSNQKFEFRILIGVDLTGTVWARFRYQDGSNYYQVRISESASRVYLEKLIGGSFTTLGSFSQTLFDNDLVRIVASSNHFDVYWNGQKKLTLDDPSPPGTPLSGLIKFLTAAGTPAYVDDVRVWNTASGTITTASRDAGSTNRPLQNRITWTGGPFRWADSRILSSADNVAWSDPHYVKAGPKSAADYPVPEGDQTRYYKIRVELRSTDDGTPALSEITTTEGVPSTPLPIVVLGYERWQYYLGGLANVVDGNLLMSERDVGLPAKGFPLEFRRSYNSKQGYSGTLGLGWTSNYNVSLSGATDVTLDDGDGSRHVYTSLGSNLYSSPAGLSATKLVKNADTTFSLFWSDGTRWNFTSAGRLSLISDRNGNKLTLTYDGSNRLSKVQDDSGLYVELLYNAGSRISTVRDQTLRSWTFAYTSNRLTQVTDPRSNSTLYFYDASNRIEKVVDRVNKLTRVVYDGSGRVSELWLGLYDRTTSSITWQYRWFAISGYANVRTRTVTDANGVASSFTLDERGTPTNITGPLAGGFQECCGLPGGESVAGQFDGERNKVISKDGKGYTWRFTYDYRGDGLTSLDPTGNASSLTWDNRDTGVFLISLPTKNTNFRGYSTTYAYDPKGNLVTITNAMVVNSYLTYDSAGFVKTSKDFRGYQTNYTYDSHGWVTEVKNPLQFITKSGYDSLGRRVNTTTPLNFKTVYEYDSLDRLTKLTDPLLNFTRFEYSARGDITKAIDPNGYVTSYVINVTLGRASKTVEPGGNFSIFVYDTRGNLVSVTNPRSLVTSYQYDAYSRLVNETKPGGNYTRFTYDRNGNVVTRIDPNGNVTTYGYDKLNRATKLTYPGSNVVTNQYDSNGNVLQTAGQGYMRTGTFDSLDRPTSATDNYGSFSKGVAYQYDADSHRTRMNYSDTTFVTYAYDKAGWLTYENQSESQTWSFGYDHDGRRTSMNDPDGLVTTYGYDAADRETSVVLKQGASTIESFTYDYDKAGNRLKVTESDGSWVRYAYDNLYRLVNESYSSGRWISYLYDANGNRIQKSEKQLVPWIFTLRPNADGSPLAWSRFPATGSHFDKVSESAPDGDSTYVYTPTPGLSESLTLTDLPSGGVSAVNYVEVYAMARVTAIQIQAPASVSLRVNGIAGTGKDLTMSYAYYSQQWTTNPATGQAWTFADVQALQVGAQSNAVDQGQIRVTQVDAVVKVTNPIITTLYTYGKDDQLLREEVQAVSTTVYSYDKNGNLKTKTSGASTTNYAYDAENRVTSVTTSSGTTSYAYTGDGRRMKRILAGTTVFFGYDASDFHGYEDVTEEYNSAGTKTAAYVHGPGIDEPLGFKSSAWYAYHQDALGSVTRLTNSSGGTLSTYRYDAFGAIRSQTGANNSYGFASRENEVALGLYYNRARFYDPAQGRFLSTDPIGLQGGVNRYAYVGNNPANIVDPSGRYPPHKGGGGGGGGGSVSAAAGPNLSICASLWFNFGMAVVILIASMILGWAAYTVAHATLPVLFVMSGLRVSGQLADLAAAFAYHNPGQFLATLGGIFLTILNYALAMSGFWTVLGIMSRLVTIQWLVFQLIVGAIFIGFAVYQLLAAHCPLPF